MNITSTRSSGRLWLGVAAAFTILFLLNTGLVASFGRWYSDWAPLRLQTNALLKGSLAIANTPTEIWEDQVWYNGGAQQVWGLGVPLWRLPFEGLARVAGQPFFPDRLAFGVAYFLIAYWVFKTFLRQPTRLEPNELVLILRDPIRLPIVVVLLLFPPIVNTCRFHFAVYDEVEVYSYLGAIALFLGTLAVCRDPSCGKLWTLALAAGFAPLVRPTLGAYAMVTLLFLLWVSMRTRHRILAPLVALALFSLGGLVLFKTNELRFGSGFEFGHHVNLNGFPVWYFTRFDAPFEREAPVSAARELFGSLFCVGTLNGFDHLKAGFFWGQSPTPRWRQFYMTTYDLSFLVLVLAGWGLPLWRRVFSGRAKVASPEADSDGPAVPAIAALWSLLSAVPLIAFYLRAPSMSSRYVLDFAPAFAVAIVALLLHVESRFMSKIRSSPPVANYLLAGSMLWIGWHILTVENKDIILSHPLSIEELAKYNAQTWPAAPGFPAFYTLGTNRPTQPMIPYNTMGWDRRNGELETVASLFVSDPEFLELHLAPLAGPEEKSTDYGKVQAKVGLEPLVIKSIVASPEGKIVTFAAPTKEVYRKGIQEVFIAYVDPNRPVRKESPLKLLKAAWRHPSESKEKLVNAPSPGPKL